jgi:CrcB protein
MLSRGAKVISEARLTHMNYVLVFVGGGLGAVLRFTVNAMFSRVGSGFPLHTLVENVSGSVVMGLLAGYFAFRANAPQYLTLFLTTGVLGGYTTFSAFSLDAVLLYDRHQYGMAVLYVLASVLGSILGLALGLFAVRLSS